MGSLKYQFKSVIDANFKEGVDKHSYKKLKNGKTRIFSYSTRRAYIKFSCNLVNYLKVNYPEVKRLIEIKPNHLEDFFTYKAQYCTPNTIYQYSRYLHTLEKLIKQTLHFNVNLTEGYNIPKRDKKSGKIRVYSMKQSDLSKVLESCKDSKSPCVIGLRLVDLFGLRVSEICKLKGKDIDLENNILHIHESKGKRSRNLPINNLLRRQLCIELKENVSDEERVCPVREDTLNKFLSRKLTSLKITAYKGGKTGIHSIRKKAAKEWVNDCTYYGMTKKESLDYVSNQLGHNNNREAVINTYVNAK